MNNEEKILAILEGVQSNISDLKADVAELKTDVSGLKADVAELKTDVSGLKADVAELKTDVADMKVDIGKLQEGQKKLEAGQTKIRKDIRDMKHELERGVWADIKRLDNRIDRNSAAIARLEQAR